MKKNKKLFIRNYLIKIMLIVLRIYLSNQFSIEEHLNEILTSLKIYQYKIIKRSIDARNKAKIIIEYRLLLNEKDGINILNLDEGKKKNLLIQSIKSIEKIDYSYEEYNFNDVLFIKNKIKRREREVKKEKEERAVKVEEVDKLNRINYQNLQKSKNRPVIVGFGPAGIFATFAFLENNISPIIIEMGEKVEDRSITIENYIKTKKFNKHSNINFGEGGAGTYSDGKLYTRSRDEVNAKIYSTFCNFGAPSTILYDAYPHIGSDNLIKVVSNIRNYFEEEGVEFYFNTKLIDIEENFEKSHEGRWRLKFLNFGQSKIKDLKSVYNLKNYKIKIDENVKYESEDEKNIFEINSDIVLIASGHSCKDIYKVLYKLGAKLEPKPFALGFRVEHPRVLIDKNQYGKFHRFLPSANYKLLFKGKTSNIYSFCMCPGGVVLPSNSEEEEIVTNGASKYLRDGQNSNAAIVCSISNQQAKQFIEEFNNNFLIRLKSFAPIKKSLSFEVGLVSKNLIKLNLDSNQISIEIENNISENQNNFIKAMKESIGKINCFDWEINLITQQIFEKLAFLFGEKNFSAPFENISDFFMKNTKDDERIDDGFYYDEKNNPKIPTTYPFGLYKAKLLKLFPLNIEDDFKAAFKYFDKIINGYIEHGIAVGYETRTSSVIKVLRNSEGEVLEGIYMIGEGSGYCGGITTSAVDGYKIASILAKKL